MTEFVVLDVFTDRPFGGNQLAVLPDATALREADLQPIAREFNFSETTFVYPPADAALTARVRIFTPVEEIPFAGHPTIGTAVALAHRGAGPDMVLELGVGPVAAWAEGDRGRFRTTQPLALLGELGVDAAAAAAGLQPGDIRADRHPPAIATLGLPFVLAEAADLDALQRARPAAEAFAEALAHVRQPEAIGIYLYVRDGREVRARMFAPLAGVPEDPATGSAAATLAAFLSEREAKPVELDIAQGVEVGRPSRIEVAAAAGSVTVSGRAIEVMRGSLSLPERAST